MLLICLMYFSPINNLLIRSLSILLLTMLHGTYVLIAQNSSDKSHKVLVLHSYHQGYYWTDEINKGIFETFSDNKNTEVFVEYMDVIRNKSIQHFQLLDVLYEMRYTQNEIKFDVIIVSDDEAFNYLLERREELFLMLRLFFWEWMISLLIGSKD
jgi:hypothetical protein